MSESRDDAPLSPAEQEAVGWLSRLREGGRRYQAEFEDWYSTDPVNADAYDRVLATYEEAGRGDITAVPSSRRHRHWGMAMAAVAAAVALFAYLGVAATSSIVTRSEAYAVSTRTGEIRTVALEDGTRVTLDTQSAIRTDYNAAQRQVRLLRGRAHFDVAAGPRPFIIATEGGSVATSGSVLDVASFDGKTQIGLVRGAADLQPIGQMGGHVRIAPGTRLVAARDGAVGAATKLSVNDMRWTAGMLAFEGVPVATVIATANRYSDAQIVLADPALGNLRFTGTVKARDTVGLARMIAAMFDLRLDAANAQRFRLSR